MDRIMTKWWGSIVHQNECFYGMFLESLKGDSTTNNLTMLRLKPEADICITILASQSLTNDDSDLSLVVKDILEVI